MTYIFLSGLLKIFTDDSDTSESLFTITCGADPDAVPSLQTSHNPSSVEMQPSIFHLYSSSRLVDAEKTRSEEVACRSSSNAHGRVNARHDCRLG